MAGRRVAWGDLCCDSGASRPPPCARAGRPHFDDVRQRRGRSGHAIQLPAAVIGDFNRRRAVRDALLRILRRQNGLDDDRQAGFLADELDVAEIQIALEPLEQLGQRHAGFRTRQVRKSQRGGKGKAGTQVASRLPAHSRSTVNTMAVQPAAFARSGGQGRGLPSAARKSASPPASRAGWCGYRAESRSRDSAA